MLYSSPNLATALYNSRRFNDLQAAHQEQMGLPAVQDPTAKHPGHSRNAAEMAELLQQLPADIAAAANRAMQCVQSSSDWQVRSLSLNEAAKTLIN